VSTLPHAIVYIFYSICLMYVVLVQIANKMGLQKKLGSHEMFVLALKGDVLITGAQPRCRWENHSVPATMKIASAARVVLALSESAGARRLATTFADRPDRACGRFVNAPRSRLVGFSGLLVLPCRLVFH
jgi:hypothetical protein